MELNLVTKIGYYLLITYFIYFINSGRWRKNLFHVDEETYEELKDLDHMFFPNEKKYWKKKFFKVARFIWSYSIYFIGISQLIGIYFVLKLLNSYNENYSVYLIHIIFIIIIPIIFIAISALARYYILEEMIQYFERRNGKKNDWQDDNKV